jgi:general secretion pathway protein I
MTCVLKKQSGFSLIEVIAALVIFVLVFAALLQTLGIAMRNTRASTEISRATLLAQSKMDTLDLEKKLEARSESGRFDDVYSFRLNLTPYQITDQQTAAGSATGIASENGMLLFQVDLTVYWTAAGKTKEQTFRTLKSRLKDGQFF